jgi:hypothetical protein
MAEIIHKLPVPTDAPYRLGRHIHHDTRSLNYAFAADKPSRDVTTLWSYTQPILNQWNTNACTGNAMAGFFNTDFAAPVRRAKKVSWCTESLALQFYSVATHEEGDPEYFYPPHDGGSDGLDIAKAAVELNWADRYQHCFGFAEFRAALQVTPCLVGTLWTRSMFNPDPSGLVHIGALTDENVAGGHEYLALGINYSTQLVTCLTSWGPDFGRRGQFDVSFSDFETLLMTQGDVIVPHGITMP